MPKNNDFHCPIFLTNIKSLRNLVIIYSLRGTFNFIPEFIKKNVNILLFEAGNLARKCRYIKCRSVLKVRDLQSLTIRHYHVSELLMRRC